MNSPASSAASDPDRAGANQLEDAADDPRVLHALNAYVAACDAGAPPDRTTFVARYPEIAEPLARCLESLAFVYAALPAARMQPVPPSAHSPVADMPAALGDFRIVREIGRGGMGVVYEAEQLSLGRRVAIKVLPFASALDASRLQRFKNEAQAAAQLHHTNIVPVFAVGCDRGVHYYAMQLIEGKTLASVIWELRGHGPAHAPVSSSASAQVVGRQTEDWREGAPRPLRPSSGRPQPAVSPERSQDTVRAFETTPLVDLLSKEKRTSRPTVFNTVANLGIQAAVALEHAHQMGVIHRDIKPGNLLIDAFSKLWVADFGLAQFHAVDGLTVTGNFPGTIRYMSPEQATGQRVLLDHRTDIYSLGITLYELLTLRPAFDDCDGRVLIRHIATEEPVAPRLIDRSIPEDLETIVLKAMAKAPAERYATAQALADDLQRFVSQQPIQARRPSPVDRLLKWSRRHRPLVLAGVLALLVTSLGLLASTILIAREHAKTKVAFQRERVQRTAAEQSFLQARQAVDTFTQLSEEELVSKPWMYQLRQKFLQAGLDYYEQFLDQHHGDAMVQAELVAARQRVARIVDELSALAGLGPLMLLSDADVQSELGLSVDERDRVDALIAALWNERDEVKQAARSPDARQRGLAAALRDHEEQIGEILNSQQFTRLRQLALQQRGPFAFKKPEVIDALALTAAQRSQISDIIEANAPHRRGPGKSHFAGGPDDRHPGRHEEGPREGFPIAASRTLAKDLGPPELKPANRLPERSFDSAAAEPPPAASESLADNPPGPPNFDQGSPDHEPHGPRIGRPHGEHHLGSRHDESPDFVEHHRGPPDGMPPGFGRPSKSMRATMERTVDEILKALTPEQRAHWQELTGPPVTFELRMSPEEMIFW